MNLIAKLYSALLKLYPPAFHDEFAEEMQTVFADALREAESLGRVTLLSLCLRELRDATVCVLREQLRERGKTGMNSLGFGNSKPDSWREPLLAIIPFGLFAPIVLVNALRLPLPDWVSAAYLWLLVPIPILFFVGLLKGLPTWSLPYLGLLASIFNLAASMSWLRIQDALPRTRVPLLQDIYSSGSPLVGLIVLTLLFVLIMGAVKPWRPIFDRLRQDWSLLSFALFGIVPLALFMAFDDHYFEEPYEAAALLVMAAGAWIYLHTSSTERKALILLGSLTLVMGIILLGRWMITPSQPWAANWTAADLEAARCNALSDTAVLWGWLATIIIVTPALVSCFIPRTDRPAESR